MEPQAHFAAAELDQSAHAVPAPARRGLQLDDAWWSSFAHMLVAICLPVTGELWLKTGMNRYGELNVGVSTAVPMAVPYFASSWVLGVFMVGRSSS